MFVLFTAAIVASIMEEKKWVCRKFVLTLLFLQLCARADLKDVLHQRIKKSADGLVAENYRLHAASCGVHRRRNIRDVHFQRYPYLDTEMNRKKTKQPFGQAAYFSGQGEVLEYRGRPNGRPLVVPNTAFSVELWLRPEGGQPVEVPVLSLVDKCQLSHQSTTWEIGFRTEGQDTGYGARVYFRLHSARTLEPTTIQSQKTYVPYKWMHVAVTYDGKTEVLYIDKAKVAVTSYHPAPIFSSSLNSCMYLQIAGRPVKKVFYRGYIDEIRMWNFALKHKAVSRNMYRELSDVPGLIFREDFSELGDWVPVLKLTPVLKPAVITSDRHDIALTVPPCGKTVCDDPDVIRSYSARWQLRNKKTLRYQVVNVREDNGESSIVSTDQINLQHKVLESAFAPYNISWKLKTMNVDNSFLRKRVILSGCHPRNIGNGACNPECNIREIAYDGGDCEKVATRCEPALAGNGRCDSECNRAYHNWDGGDCCDPNKSDTAYSCLDPTSSERLYMTEDEYKSKLNLPSDVQVNVYIVKIIQLNAGSTVGVATFPWEKETFTNLGGVLLQPENFGQMNVSEALVHELGHVLGLKHVHHDLQFGDCMDPCLETHPSLELGDLCEDTKPTPANTKCQDPDTSIQQCQALPLYTATPFNNYMSYADDKCTDHFTPQQTARMHCYSDLIYQRWREESAPSIVPLPPKVLKASVGSVTLTWIPPLNTGSAPVVCSQCLHDFSLVQFADTARSSHDRFPPSQAVGPPDAEPCKPSAHVWMHETCYKDCYIEFGFAHPVIPQKVNTLLLSLWVTWNAHQGLDDIVLHFDDDTTKSLGHFAAFCDMPLTMDLELTKKVVKVRVFVNHHSVAIDAIRLDSKPGQAECKGCPHFRYKVYRKPPFNITQVPEWDLAHFTDRTVKPGHRYSYRVRAVVNSQESDFSQELVYSHGQAFCGDGKRNRADGEECDDGNAVDGDGCSIQCHLEEFFHCKGEPSLCYLHDGDGICEPFEKASSVRDCGWFTPDGYIDQWATSAIDNPDYRSPYCPVTPVLGPPADTHVCKAQFDEENSWFPCGSYGIKGKFWLKVFFEKPVVATSVLVHLASDGIVDYSMEPKRLTAELVDTNDVTHPLGHASVVLRCKESPVEIPVKHDLSKPFYRSKGVIIRFESSTVAIAGVVLRSSKILAPLALADCESGDVYDPLTSSCLSCTCERQRCGSLSVDHGTVQCSGDTEGHKCKITCLPGYIVKAEHKTVTCAAGNWTVQETDTICRPVDCGIPRIPHASSDCPEGTEYRRRCKFTCMAPTKPQGNDNTLTCEADGYWSVPNSYCRVLCPGPPKLRHARLQTPSCRGQTLGVGTVCSMRCVKGYHVEGRSAKVRLHEVHCSESGEWSGPVCVPVQCEAPDVIYTGMLGCTNGFQYGSTCTITCPTTKQELSTICEYTGQWSGSFESCSLIGRTCPEISPRQGFHISCGENKVGSRCQVRCTAEGKEPALKQSGNVTQAAVTDSTRLVCTALQQWFPEPAMLECKDMCSTEYVGDLFCDGPNNRMACQWDGGDCCASTVRGGMVQLLDPTCGEECRCKDPQAVENRSVSGPSQHRAAAAAAVQTYNWSKGYFHHKRRWRHKDKRSLRAP